MSLYEKKLYRRIKTVLIMATVLYVLFGAVLVYQVFAQQHKSVITTGTVSRVPTGNDDAAVRAYYDYLAESELPTRQETYLISPSQLGWTYGVLGAILISFFFLIYAWYARWVQGDLYPVETYNGYITERGGPVDAFNFAFYIIVGSFMLYWMITQIVYGQLY